MPYNLLISAEELHQILHQGSTVAIDCRYRLESPRWGLTQYRLGHIPGAIFIDMDHELSGPPTAGQTGRHPLPHRSTFHLTARQLGLSPKQQLVVYDQGPGCFASRAWWMFRWLGFENVAVLDGGFANWQKSNPVTQEIRTLPLADWDLPPEPFLVASAQDIMNHLGKIDLLDARNLDRFEGKNETIDPVAGHIQTARSAPFEKNLNSEGLFKEPSQLRSHYLGILSGKADEAICYCGSGVTATHNILAMKLAGLGEARLYPGSWSEWITDPKRPIETGS
ncbi:sulfurtransferase [Pseudobacteriovorax antillogorgiicola]|uniref:Sulfurtransferase n=1 Tax=Pseudobacteriovorax antillogorgiicola TaxID=1513793 RepID=A0A1Y6BED5_9BACT|nr:sulfurtransferase [Pseudobacteriovorax antillogorgiicola]TCS56334.1 thiosulfate/3-mercaptopyruvate sulfurtransferase [Pseudobacteriovorax antillogorgiicola]SMF06933.1 thiosulfate/3-mercaptopyruvate sulfurtransferase [Pseudobacteriovorax antillogorgiicola]